MHPLSNLLRHLQRLPGLDVRRLLDFAGSSSTAFRQSRHGFCRLTVCRLLDHGRQRLRRNRVCRYQSGRPVGQLQSRRCQPSVSVVGVSDSGINKSFAIKDKFLDQINT